MKLTDGLSNASDGFREQCLGSSVRNAEAFIGSESAAGNSSYVGCVEQVLAEIIGVADDRMPVCFAKETAYVGEAVEGTGRGIDFAAGYLAEQAGDEVATTKEGSSHVIGRLHICFQRIGCSVLTERVGTGSKLPLDFGAYTLSQRLPPPGTQQSTDDYYEDEESRSSQSKAYAAAASS